MRLGLPTKGTILWRICVLVSAVLASPLSHGQVFGTRLSQLSHTAWRMHEGSLTGRPQVLGQTTDGYLWVGTSVGLLRFDGVQFASVDKIAYTTFNENISALRGSSDGSLWIGTDQGLRRWKDDAFQPAPGALLGRINDILEARDGTIWLARTRPSDRAGPLCSIRGNGVRCYSQKEGFGCIYGQSLQEDQSGDIWMASNPGVCSWSAHGSEQIQPTGGIEGRGSAGADVAFMPDGDMLISYSIPGAGFGLTIRHEGQSSTLEAKGLDGAALDVDSLLVDHSGGIWIGTLTQGLFHIQNGVADHFGASDGLTSNLVYSIFEDREGNIWTTTSNGLDRFNRLKVVSVSMRDGLTSDEASSVIAEPDGSVLVGTPGGLNILKGSDVTALRSLHELPGGLITSMFVDHAGEIFIGIDEKLTLYKNGVFTELRTPSKTPVGQIMRMAEDSTHKVWAVGNHKLYRVFPDHVELASGAESVAQSIAANDTGRVYAQLRDHTVAYLNGRDIAVLPGSKAKAAFVGMRVDDEGAVWGWDRTGLSFFRSGRWSTLDSKRGLPCDRVTSVLDDKSGSWWLLMPCGIAKVPLSTLKAAETNSTMKVVPTQFFGPEDGANFFPTSYSPDVARSTDGKLWFADSAALQVVDPAHLPFNILPPPVRIERLIADSRPYSTHSDITLPALTREIEIAYTGLSLVMPERVRFRYRLIGSSNDWQDVGGRRDAFFMNLKPGEYTFQVVACNNDGVWNNTGQSLRFRILPAFYQTFWFALVCVLAALGSIVLVVSFRVRRMAHLIQDRLSARYLERLRIARDLHDTLIQGVQGLSAHVHAVMERVSGNDSAKKEMEGVLEQADRLFIEGRDRLRDLRSEIEDATDLESSLRQHIAQNHEGTSIGFEVSVTGTPLVLKSVVLDETLWIAKEAILNALKHAAADFIQVRVEYSKTALRVMIIDDGRGLEPSILSAGNRAGHWGLPGMRERAESIGGKLRIQPVEPHGTEVEVTVPGTIAFIKPAKPPVSSLACLFGLRSPRENREIS